MPTATVNRFERMFWIMLRSVWSRWRDALVIVKPETVVGWHRAGFRLYWRCRSRPRGRRPKVTGEIKDLIRPISTDVLQLQKRALEGKLSVSALTRSSVRGRVR